MSGYDTRHTDLYGGGGGHQFNDTTDQLGERGKIVQIFVRYGNVVDSLATVFANGTTLTHGENGGSLTVITFDDDEYVNSVKLRSGKKIDQITFFTNKRTHGPFGKGGGTEHTVSFNGKFLQYFFGRSNEVIDAIGFAYGNILPAGATRITKAPIVGGGGGKPFDDLVQLNYVLLRISKIRIRAASHIVRLEVTYTSGSSNTEIAHGGTGGSDRQDFTLNEREYITRVDIRTGSRLDAIKFYLNSGRQSDWYGGNSGNLHSFIAEPGHGIVSFHGRSGSEIDALGVYYSSRIPVQVVIQAITFLDNTFSQQTVGNATFTRVELNNNTSIEQEMSESRSYTYEVSSTTSFETTYSTTVEYTFEVGTEFVKNGFRIGYTAGFTTTNSQTVTQSVTGSYVFTVRVPPKSKTIGELLGTYYRTNVSWTGRAKVYYNTGDFEERDISGVLNDVQASNFQANYIEG